MTHGAISDPNLMLSKNRGAVPSQQPAANTYVQ